MIEFGSFMSKSGKRYIGHFISESNTVELLGPLQDYPNKSAMAPQVFIESATSEKEARSKIEEAINWGIIE